MGIDAPRGGAPCPSQVTTLMGWCEARYTTPMPRSPTTASAGTRSGQIRPSGGQRAAASVCRRDAFAYGGVSVDAVGFSVDHLLAAALVLAYKDR